MDRDDVIYLLLLLFSIVFGYVYKRIEGKQQKKWVGTLVGFTIVLVVSGKHIVHTFVTILINSVIILYVDKKQCHLVSFTFSFLYLVFFRTTYYFGIPYPPGHTNMVQMMLTLKLVGLAFDLNKSFKAKLDSRERSKEQMLEENLNDLPVGFSDIFHYSFNYIGILTGPYIRYKTFNDYFELPFSRYADWKGATLDKLIYVPMYGVLFLVASQYWPTSYAKTDEFYNDYSWLYRVWYIFPNFFIFRMRIYSGLVLSECVATMASFGAYPDFTDPKPGHGPSRNLRELNDMFNDDALLKSSVYNFETVHNVRPSGAELIPSFRESMKHWNMCVQYWLAMHIYKRFPHKKYRAIATMFASAVWHGVYTGYYVCLGLAPLILPIDDIYVKLMIKNRSGKMLIFGRVFMIIFKMFYFSYLSIAFHLLSLDWIMHFYNSVYHFGLILWIVLYVVGIRLLESEKRQVQSEIRERSN